MSLRPPMGQAMAMTMIHLRSFVCMALVASLGHSIAQKKVIQLAYLQEPLRIRLPFLVSMLVLMLLSSFELGNPLAITSSAEFVVVPLTVVPTAKR